MLDLPYKERSSLIRFCISVANMHSAPSSNSLKSPCFPSHFSEVSEHPTMPLELPPNTGVVSKLGTSLIVYRAC